MIYMAPADNTRTNGQLWVWEQILTKTNEGLWGREPCKRRKGVFKIPITIGISKVPR